MNGTPNPAANILVVDDAKQDSEQLKEAFEKNALPCEIHLAYSSKECIRFLTRTIQFPSLIILSLNMPRMSGFSLLHTLRRMPQWRRLPIVVYSVSNREAERKQAYVFGATAIMAKPTHATQMSDFAQQLYDHYLADLYSD
ncbi:MAG: response regulator [Cytophagaceae bacterium]|nr:response regulator [Cytophagaceae bacterium]